MISVKVLVSLFILIFLSLGFACYFLLTERNNSTRTVKSLTTRILLSFVLFGFLIVAFAMGWLHPHGLGERAAPTASTNLEPVYEHKQE